MGKRDSDSSEENHENNVEDEEKYGETRKLTENNEGGKTPRTINTKRDEK